MLGVYLEFIQLELNSNFEIGKSSIHGNGVIATKFIKNGSFINKAMCRVIEKDLVKHKVTYFGSFLNHSYKPNAELREKDTEYDTYALCDINPGDEITVDYTTCDDIQQPKPNWKQKGVLNVP